MTTILFATFVSRNKYENQLSRTTYAHWTIEGLRDRFEKELNDWFAMYEEDWMNITDDSPTSIYRQCTIHNLECKVKYIQVWKRELSIVQIRSIHSDEILFEMILNEATVSK